MENDNEQTSTKTQLDPIKIYKTYTQFLMLEIEELTKAANKLFNRLNATHPQLLTAPFRDNAKQRPSLGLLVAITQQLETILINTTDASLARNTSEHHDEVLFLINRIASHTRNVQISYDEFSNIQKFAKMTPLVYKKIDNLTNNETHTKNEGTEAIVEEFATLTIRRRSDADSRRPSMFTGSRKRSDTVSSESPPTKIEFAPPTTLTQKVKRVSGAFFPFKRNSAPEPTSEKRQQPATLLKSKSEEKPVNSTNQSKHNPPTPSA